MKTFITILTFFLAVLPGCAQQDVNAGNQHRKSVIVKAGAEAELCFVSKKDDEIVFRFEAEQPLDFNLHYHLDDEMFYPIPEHSTAAEKGQYFVPKDDTYCLLWKNNNDRDVRLSVDLSGGEEATWY